MLADESTGGRLQDSSGPDTCQTPIARKGAIDEEGQLVCHIIGVTQPDAPYESLEPLEHRFLVAGTNLSRRVIRLGELGCDIDLRTAAISIATDPPPDPVEQRHELARRIAPNGIDHLVPLLPKLPILALQESGDQVILRVEVTVEACLRHSGIGDDPLDADRPNTVRIEEARCRLEYARRGIAFIGVSGCHSGFFRR